MDFDGGNCGGVLRCKIGHPTTRILDSSSDGDILGTKRGIIDPLVSKRPETNSKEEKKWSKMVKTVKIVKVVQNGSKWFKMVQNGEKLSKLPKMVKIAKNGPKWSK